MGSDKKQQNNYTGYHHKQYLSVTSHSEYSSWFAACSCVVNNASLLIGIILNNPAYNLFSVFSVQNDTNPSKKANLSCLELQTMIILIMRSLQHGDA